MALVSKHTRAQQKVGGTQKLRKSLNAEYLILEMVGHLSYHFFLCMESCPIKENLNKILH